MGIVLNPMMRLFVCAVRADNPIAFIIAQESTWLSCPDGSVAVLRQSLIQFLKAVDLVAAKYFSKNVIGHYNCPRSEASEVFTGICLFNSKERGGQHQRSTTFPPCWPGSEVNQLPHWPGSEINHLPRPGSEVNHPPPWPGSAVNHLWALCTGG